MLKLLRSTLLLSISLVSFISISNCYITSKKPFDAPPPEKFSSEHNWGIGICLGDPTGVTFKRYLGSNALELSIGRTHFIGKSEHWNNYYRDKWEEKYCESF